MRILALAAVLAACAAPPRPHAAPPGSPRLERELLALLPSESGLGVLHVFEQVGEARHVPAITAMLGHADPTVRAAALGALGRIAATDATAAPAVLEPMRRGLRDPARTVRHAAVLAWPERPDSDWRDLVALLRDEDVRLRLVAAAVLARNGVPLPAADVTALLRDAAGTGEERHVVGLFDRLRDRAAIPLLEPYLACPDKRVQFRAHEAIDRIVGLAAGAAADWRPRSQAIRESGQRTNEVAERSLRSLPWAEVDRAEVLAAAARSRLVMFGEFHVAQGHLREAQQAVLRAMVVAGGGRVVLGYEPSVEAPQRSVIELALALGARVLPLETDWQELNAAHRFLERDDQAAAVINATLAADPGCRMLVIRGEGHTVPGGYLARQLRETPLIVLSAEFPPLAALQDRPVTLGRTFRRGDGIYCWGAFDVFSGVPDLAHRLAPGQ